MKKLFFLLLIVPFIANATTCPTGVYRLSSTFTTFSIGNSTFPVNSMALTRSTDTNAVGFSYLFPFGYFIQSQVFLTPQRFNKFYTVSGSDTICFSSASAVINWYNTNAADTFADAWIPSGYTVTNGFVFSPDTSSGKLATKTDISIGEIVGATTYNVVFSDADGKFASDVNLQWDGSRLGNLTQTSGISISGKNTIIGDIFGNGSGATIAVNGDGGDCAFNNMINISFGNAEFLNTPTTLGGYNITDGLTSANALGYQVVDGNDFAPDTSQLATHTWVNTQNYLSSVSWDIITGAPTTLAGYGITDPVVLTSGSYSNPLWITALAGSKITGLAVASANGFAGSYSAPTFTLSTSVTGILKGNGTAISAATANDLSVLSNRTDTLLTATGTGVAVSFTYTITAGHSFSNFQSQNAATPTVIYSSVSGTTLTIVCASAPILSASVSFGGFFK